MNTADNGRIAQAMNDNDRVLMLAAAVQLLYSPKRAGRPGRHALSRGWRVAAGSSVAGSEVRP